MSSTEFFHVLVAIIILTAVAGVPLAWENGLPALAPVLFFAIIIIGLSVSAKKIMANLLDADVEHEIWKASRYGVKAGWHLPKPIPVGILVPLFFLLFSLGQLKILTLMTYETCAKKIRAAKRFGFFSYTAMTDWHNALVGAAGIIAMWILTVIAYFLAGTASFLPPNLEYLAKLSTFYAFWNMFPISKLDGAQIFFGSRVLYAVLATITLIFMAYALMLPA